MTTTVFAFAMDPVLRPWSRLFLVHPETCSVRVSPHELTIHFGRWSLSTTPDNVADIITTGPYQRWKVAGPAHLSLADRGVTFATTAERGVCIAFRTPVPAIDPLGLVRHPAATVTVADPEGFAAALRNAAVDTPDDDDDPPNARRQGTYLAAARAVVRWTRRGGSVEVVDRDVDTVEPPSAQHASEDVVQRFEDGVGPGFHRRFHVVVDRPAATAASLMAAIRADPNVIADEMLAPFVKTSGRTGAMWPGDRYVVAMAGPWSGPVEVVEVDARRLRMVTLEGHLEAGVMEFRAVDADDGSIEFTIETWARSGDRALLALYDVFDIARRLQSEMWVEACEAVAGIAGGHQRGPVVVTTERAGSLASSRSPDPGRSS